jgi:hypothetical protein
MDDDDCLYHIFQFLTWTELRATACTCRLYGLAVASYLDVRIRKTIQCLNTHETNIKHLCLSNKDWVMVNAFLQTRRTIFYVEPGYDHHYSAGRVVFMNEMWYAYDFRRDPTTGQLLVEVMIAARPCPARKKDIAFFSCDTGVMLCHKIAEIADVALNRCIFNCSKPDHHYFSWLPLVTHLNLNTSIRQRSPSKLGIRRSSIGGELRFVFVHGASGDTRFHVFPPTSYSPTPRQLHMHKCDDCSFVYTGRAQTLPTVECPAEMCRVLGVL